MQNRNTNGRNREKKKVTNEKTEKKKDETTIRRIRHEVIRKGRQFTQTETNHFKAMLYLK